MVFTCSGHAPSCWGPWSCRDNNRQLPAPGRGLRAFKGLEVCGEKKPPSTLASSARSGPPLPPQLAFCFEICAPLPPAPTSEQQERFNRGQFCFGSDKKAPRECDLASPLSGLPCFVCACNGFCSKGQRSWTWIWCVPGVFFLFPFLGRG